MKIRKLCATLSMTTLTSIALLSTQNAFAVMIDCAAVNHTVPRGYHCSCADGRINTCVSSTCSQETMQDVCSMQSPTRKDGGKVETTPAPAPLKKI